MNIFFFFFSPLFRSVVGETASNCFFGRNLTFCFCLFDWRTRSEDPRRGPVDFFLFTLVFSFFFFFISFFCESRVFPLFSPRRCLSSFPMGEQVGFSPLARNVHLVFFRKIDWVFFFLPFWHLIQQSNSFFLPSFSPAAKQHFSSVIREKKNFCSVIGALGEDIFFPPFRLIRVLVPFF